MGSRISAPEFRGRKGQIEISFNWIFVLIAGGVILVFFILATKHEKQSAVEHSANAVSNKLETLLSAMQQNPDAVQERDSLSTELEFGCDQTGHWYRIKDAKQNYLDSQLIFTPEIVGGSKTIAWTQLYSSPYPVAYILYYTDEKTQYIFVDTGGGSNTIRQLYAKLPDSFEKNLTTKDKINELEDKGFRKYIVVVDDSILSGITLRDSMKKKSTIVAVNAGLKKVRFKKNDGTPLSTKYFNNETLYGAIISGDPQLYGCTMEKIMYASRVVSAINLQRTELLSSAVMDTGKCRSYYQTGMPISYINAIIENSTYAQDGDDYIKLQIAVDTLENLNRDLFRASCPTIY